MFRSYLKVNVCNEDIANVVSSAVGFLEHCNFIFSSSKLLKQWQCLKVFSVLIVLTFGIEGKNIRFSVGHGKNISVERMFLKLVKLYNKN